MLIYEVFFNTAKVNAFSIFVCIELEKGKNYKCLKIPQRFSQLQYSTSIELAIRNVPTA